MATAIATTRPARTMRRTTCNIQRAVRNVRPLGMNLKLLLKRGALVAVANWPTIAIQFAAETTFQVLLAVPIIGAAILVAALLGGDLTELLRGGLRDTFATIAGTLMSEPVALVAFIAAFTIVLLGGSVLTFLVKGGTVD